MSTVPRITERYEVKTSTSDISINKESLGYTDIFNLPEFCIIHRIQVSFNNPNVFVKLQIGDNNIFEFDLSAMKNTFASNDADSSIFRFNSNGNILSFKPNFPILAKGGVKFSAKALTESISRESNGYIIERALV